MPVLIPPQAEDKTNSNKRWNIVELRRVASRRNFVGTQKCCICTRIVSYILFKAWLTWEATFLSYTYGTLLQDMEIIIMPDFIRHVSKAQVKKAVNIRFCLPKAFQREVPWWNWCFFFKKLAFPWKWRRTKYFSPHWQWTLSSARVFGSSTIGFN